MSAQVDADQRTPFYDRNARLIRRSATMLLCRGTQRCRFRQTPVALIVVDLRNNTAPAHRKRRRAHGNAASSLSMSSAIFRVGVDLVIRHFPTAKQWANPTVAACGCASISHSSARVMSLYKRQYHIRKPVFAQCLTHIVRPSIRPNCGHIRRLPFPLISPPRSGVSR